MSSLWSSSLWISRRSSALCEALSRCTVACCAQCLNICCILEEVTNIDLAESHPTVTMLDVANFLATAARQLSNKKLLLSREHLRISPIWHSEESQTPAIASAATTSLWSHRGHWSWSQSFWLREIFVLCHRWRRVFSGGPHGCQPWSHCLSQAFLGLFQLLGNAGISRIRD